MVAEEERKENIWESILKEGASSSFLPTAHLIVLGDRGCGKSKLIEGLKGKASLPSKKDTKPPPELALSFTHLDVLNEEKDETLGRLGVWQFEGNENYRDLLHFALNQETISQAMILIALDFSKPWNFMESLHRWAEILEASIDSLGLDSELHESLRERNKQAFLNFRSPQGDTSEIPVEQELPREALVKNLGIPIMIACLKSDAISSTLEREFGYKDNELEHLQFHLRRFALHYGASLFYVSVVKDLNVQALLNYTTSQLFSTPMKEKENYVDKEKLFFPSGWDTLDKMGILGVSPPSNEQEVLTHFNKVIRRPHIDRQSEIKETREEDEQDFLRRHMDDLAKDSPATASPGSSSPLAKTGTLADKAKPQKPAGTDPAQPEVLAFFQNLVKKKNPTGK